MHACSGPCSMGGWVFFCPFRKGRRGWDDGQDEDQTIPYRVQLFMRFMHRACPAHSAGAGKSVRQINSKPKRFMKMQFYFLKTQTHIPAHAAHRMPDIRSSLPGWQSEWDRIGLVGVGFGAWSWVDQRRRCPIGYEMMRFRPGRLIGNVGLLSDTVEDYHTKRVSN